MCGSHVSHRCPWTDARHLPLQACLKLVTLVAPQAGLWKRGTCRGQGHLLSEQAALRSPLACSEGRWDAGGEHGAFQGGRVFWGGGGVLRSRGHPGEAGALWEAGHPLPGPCHQLLLGNPVDMPGTVEGVWEWGRMGECGWAGCRSMCTCVWPVCGCVDVCMCAGVGCGHASLCV